MSTLSVKTGWYAVCFTETCLWITQLAKSGWCFQNSNLVQYLLSAVPRIEFSVQVGSEGIHYLKNRYSIHLHTYKGVQRCSSHFCLKMFPGGQAFGHVVQEDLDINSANPAASRGPLLVAPHRAEHGRSVQQLLVIRKCGLTLPWRRVPVSLVFASVLWVYFMHWDLSFTYGERMFGCFVFEKLASYYLFVWVHSPSCPNMTFPVAYSRYYYLSLGSTTLGRCSFPETDGPLGFSECPDFNSTRLTKIWF